jgi:hypothetical protein
MSYCKRCDLRYQNSLGTALQAVHCAIFMIWFRKDYLPPEAQERLATLFCCSSGGRRCVAMRATIALGSSTAHRYGVMVRGGVSRLRFLPLFRQPIVVALQACDNIDAEVRCAIGYVKSTREAHLHRALAVPRLSGTAFLMNWITSQALRTCR